MEGKCEDQKLKYLQMVKFRPVECLYFKFSIVLGFFLIDL